MTLSLFEIAPPPAIGEYNPNLAAQREAARQARDEAIERADGGADVRFMELALDAVRRAAETLPELTSDDVVALCAMTAREPRQWGAVMQRARRDGIIAPLERWRQSSNRTNHARPMRLWRSLVFAGADAPDDYLREIESYGENANPPR